MGRQRGPAFYDTHYATQPRRARHIAWERHREVARHIVGNTILDLACGVGLIANMIGDRSYLGIDFSREAIAASRRVCENDNAQFVVESAFNLDQITADLFDTVLLIEILEHIENPDELVDLALAHCNERMIVTVPVEMRAPSHVKPCWTQSDIEGLVNVPCQCRQFGGPYDDWWWLAIWDTEGR